MTPTGVKVCGITRPADAEMVFALGASYAGVIFAGGPREVTVEQATEIVNAASGLPVAGVFADANADVVRRAVESTGVSIVQLHGPHSASDIRAIRSACDCFVWSVLRTTGTIPAHPPDSWREADAVLIDALVPGQLGGAGVTGDWDALALNLAGRRPVQLVLAGGLQPFNVRRAIERLQPDVLDVCSGVEERPGIKDPDRVAAFIRAAAGAAAA